VLAIFGQVFLRQEYFTQRSAIQLSPCRTKLYNLERIYFPDLDHAGVLPLSFAFVQVMTRYSYHKWSRGYMA
jgi:hypothetical protein